MPDTVQSISNTKGAYTLEKGLQTTALRAKSSSTPCFCNSSFIGSPPLLFVFVLSMVVTMLQQDIISCNKDPMAQKA